jgi:cell division protein FtsZ
MSETPELIENMVSLKIVGIGGAGINALNTMVATNVPYVEFVAVSTSPPRLRASKATTKIQIGSDPNGFSTGGDPEKARRGVEHSRQEILQHLTGVDLTFLVAGLGSGTGTGATPEIAKLAKTAGSLVAACQNQLYVATLGSSARL